MKIKHLLGTGEVHHYQTTTKEQINSFIIMRFSHKSFIYKYI